METNAARPALAGEAVTDTHVAWLGLYLNARLPA
jgi:hypothetical protein